ncbi:MAG: hypothetical protein AABX02_05460 [archaeon]
MNQLISPFKKKKVSGPSSLRKRIEKEAMRDMYPPKKKRFIRQG